MLSPSTLGAHTGFRLRRVSNAVSHDFARRLADEGVTVAEWAVLRTLFDVDAVAPSVLAGAMGMTRGAISKLADRLIGKRLIERAANPDDGRAHRLSLTAAGRAKVPALAVVADAIEADYFGVLDAGDRATLRRLLDLLAERRGLSAIPVD